MDDRDLDTIRSVPLDAVMDAWGDGGLITQRNPDRLQARCPFHDDHNPSFSGYDKGQGWRFRCFAASSGAHGDVLDYVGLKLFGAGWNPRDTRQFTDVLQWFYDNQSALGITIAAPNTRSRRRFTAPPPVQRLRKPAPEPDPVLPTEKAQRVWAWFLGVSADLLFSNNTKEVVAARRYLKQRGFDEATLRRYRFGWAPANNPNLLLALGKSAGYTPDVLIAAGLLRRGQRGLYPHFRGRIVFADVDRVGNPVYVIGRIHPSIARRREQAGKPVVKYLGVPDFTKPILGLQSLGGGKSPIFLLEGPWDALLVRQWGFEAVAISGGMMSDFQQRQLLRLDRMIIPIPDNDEGGENALLQWREALPPLRPPLRLPNEVEGEPVKDIGDLAKTPGGRRLFVRLAKQRLAAYKA